MEELISIQKYASLNRLSIHTVIKKTMNGELQTVVKEENGKEVTYILNPKIEKKLLKRLSLKKHRMKNMRLTTKRRMKT